MELKSFVKESHFNKMSGDSLISQLFSDAFSSFGFGNGYVLVPKEHPCWGVPYDQVPVEVHWGLTFGEKVTPGMASTWNIPEDTIGMWCFGFDTAHYGDSLAKWPKEKVEEETARLLQQFIDLEHWTYVPEPEYDINKDQQEDDKHADVGL